MVFSSFSFLCFFLPVLLTVYFLVPSRKGKNLVLLAGSLFFYAWGEPKFLLLLILSTFSAYLGGLGMAHFSARRSTRKIIFAASVSILLANLFIFKYLNFAVDNLAILFPGISVRQIVLPIGISFYTFQTLSYLIDLYRNEIKVQRNYCALLLYVSLFPQLIAGPIVRYKTVEDEIDNRRESLSDVVSGSKRFILGLAKKVILANNLSRVAEIIYASSSNYNATALYWLAALAYALQIYYDFSGYSDMAIGLGRIFGFHFLENFTHPYASHSVTEFWRRWHISLGSWFRDYVYIPLGGNRVSLGRHIFNLAVVWALTGFWHGASWNFVLWGLFQFVFLVLEKFFIARFLERLPRFVSWLYAFTAEVFGLVIFYFTDMSALIHAIKTLLCFHPSDFSLLLSENISLLRYLPFLIPGIIFMFPIIKTDKTASGTAALIIENGIYLLLFALCIMFLLSSAYNPFIYFRF